LTEQNLGLKRAIFPLQYGSQQRYRAKPNRSTLAVWRIERYPTIDWYRAINILNQSFHGKHRVVWLDYDIAYFLRIWKDREGGDDFLWKSVLQSL
jgi:hypothetical protein